MSKKNSFIGIDFGGTSIKAILHGEDHFWSSPEETSTKGSEVQEIKGKIFDLVQTLIDNSPSYSLKGIGLGLPGICDDQGQLLIAPNLDPAWLNINLKQELQSQSNVPVFLENDANVAALGEALAGDSQYSNLLFLTLGTGLGTGIIIDNRIYRGSQGYAAEGGHIVVNPNGTKCGCGKMGCLETEFSATALIRKAKIAALNNPQSSISMYCRGNVDTITAKTVFDAAMDDDMDAQKILKESVNYLAMGISNFCAVLDPEVVVMGGGITLAGDYLMELLHPKLDPYFTFQNYKRPKIKISKMQNEAGMKGAAMLAKTGIT